MSQVGAGSSVSVSPATARDRAAVAIGHRQFGLQPDDGAERDRAPLIFDADLHILAPIDRLQIEERAFPERLRALDDAVDPLGLGIGRRERVAVRRILHLRRQPGVLVEIFDDDGVGILLAEHGPVDLRRIPNDLAIGQQHGRDVAPFVADNRNRIAEPEMFRARGAKDLVERIGHGDRRLEAIIESVAAAVASARE